MKYNLSLYDIIARYAAVLLIVVIGQLVFHSLILMLLAVPVFMEAILGWDPIYQLLHINHAVATDKEEG